VSCGLKSGFEEDRDACFLCLGVLRDAEVAEVVAGVLPNGFSEYFPSI
jgi:hypothetical protein